MVSLKIKLDLEKGAFNELVTGKELIHLTNEITIASLKHGTSSGRGTIAFGFELPSGQFVIAETTVRLFLQAAKVIAMKHPNEAAEVNV